MGADVLNGVDANCARWLKKFRQAPPTTITEGGEVRERRERRRRRG
jgi:5-methyltetrahydrofolate--homocysteine methyltransferase